MTRKEYFSPCAEICLLESTDVITTSGEIQNEAVFDLEGPYTDAWW